MQDAGGRVFREQIPEELKKRDQWVMWCYEPDDKGEPTKVPYQTKHIDKPIRASHTDMLTWGTFVEAWNAYSRNGRAFDGIGFVFCSGDPFTGIDLDKCRDPETGAVAEWTQEIVDGFVGYKEISPSGRGVHIIIRAKTREPLKRGKIEVYSQERYFTITGRAL